MKPFAIIALAGLVAATPFSWETKTLTARGTYCGKNDLEKPSGYIIYNNLWGEDQASSGYQCTTNNGATSDGGVTWSTKWTWSGGSTKVKSYANAVVNSEAKPLSQVSSIPSKWTWTYTGDDLVANVAYDIFTSTTADGDHKYELMVWLDALGGAQPISTTGSAVATATLLGHHWELWEGTNKGVTVFTFRATTPIQSFDGNLMEFLYYLMDNKGVSKSQYLRTIGAGTEPFTGSNAVFKTSYYSAAVEYD